MRYLWGLLCMGALLGVLAVSGCDEPRHIQATQATVLPSNTSSLEARLSAAGLKMGSPVFVRIFKQEGVLELWMQPSNEPDQPQAEFVLFHTYPICYFSGTLGPKRAQGDKQAPEGFYAVGINQLNPHSQYHLAFNLGFPNAYDRSQGYTGDYLMVHGKCVSVGCYAMTDPQIQEIYTLVEAALNQGQSFFRVHVFAFRLNAANLARHEKSVWFDFWKMQQPIYERFEQTHIPPNVEVIDKRYVLCDDPPQCTMPAPVMQLGM